jgi:hypothetical protein
MKDRDKPELTRRGLLGGLAAAGAVILLVKPERPACPRLSDMAGTRWIGHC